MITYAGGKLVVSRDYDVPPAAVWAIVTDTLLWPVWGPSVTKVECADRYISAGSKGRVRTALGLRLPFFIHHFEHMRSWSWCIGGLEATGHELTGLDSSRCRLAFSMPWWAVPYLPVCYIALKRINRLALNRGRHEAVQ